MNRNRKTAWLLIFALIPACSFANDDARNADPSVTASAGVREGSTSEGRNFYVWQDFKTRFGNVQAVSENAAPHATLILFNGIKVFEGDAEYVTIEKSFRVQDEDVILLSTNAGGSSTPEDKLYFLVIKSKSNVSVVSNPDFVADFGLDRDQIAVRQNGLIVIYLGSRAGRERVAEFISDRVVVHTKSKQGLPLKVDDCERLYEMGARECAGDRTHKPDCPQLLKDSDVFVTGVDMSSYRYISNKSGFMNAYFGAS